MSSLVFLVAGTLFLWNAAIEPLMYSLGAAHPTGTYRPATGEIEMFVNESHRWYDEILYHEKMHKQMFEAINLPSFLLVIPAAAGTMFTIFGYVFLSRKLWGWGGAAVLFHFVVVEGYAIGMTWLRFQDQASVDYALYIGELVVLWIVSFVALHFFLKNYDPDSRTIVSFVRELVSGLKE